MILALIAALAIPADGDRLYPIAIDQSSRGGTYIAIDLTSRQEEEGGARSAIVLSVRKHSAHAPLTEVVAVSGRVIAVCGQEELRSAGPKYALNRKGGVIRTLPTRQTSESVTDGSLAYALYYGICNLPDNP